MAHTKRILLFSFSFIFILFLVIVFWPFIFTKIIVPISTVIWIGLRMFVLSLDQSLYWVVFTLGIMVLILRRLVQWESNTENDKTLGVVVKFRDIETWHNKLSIYANTITEQESIRQKLLDLVAAWYAAEQEDKIPYLVSDAMRRKEIPLPDSIYTILFTEETEENERSFKRMLKKILHAPANWMMQKRIQRNRAMETRRMITEVLTYLETSLEINNEHR